MKTYALASDYDGTIATAGRVSPSTLDALRRFRDSGHHLILVTGREMDDLKSIFPDYSVFEMIVAENGALLHDTTSGEETLLAPPPSPALLKLLNNRQIGPLYVGKVIVATHVKHGPAIQNALHELKLIHRLIPNKEAVMLLPEGVNKKSGLGEALRRMNLDPAQAVGVGDAENDDALLEACGFGVAVANALPSLQKKAD